MSLTTRLITAEELFRLPDDGQRHELIQGELTTMTPAGFEHGAVIVRLAAQLHQHVSQRRLGVVLGAETGFIIKRNPDTVRAPDIAFVRADRIAVSGIPQAFYPGAPDLAVEVVSPQDTLNEVESKVDDWLSNGTQLVWVVNSRRKSVTVYRAPNQIAVLMEADALEGQEVVPGFQIRVSEIFA